MITTSDFLMSVLKERGYDTIPAFCRLNNLKQRAVIYAFERNSWTAPMLKKIGDILGMDLSRFVNSRLGEKHDYLDF